MNVRQRMREREAAKKFWDKLHARDREDLGDQLVLGDFDWREWFNRKPSSVFLDEVDRLRIHWEIMQGD